MLGERRRCFLLAPVALGNCLRDKSGATAIEYGLIAGIISVVIVAGLTQIGGKLGEVFQVISSTFSSLF